MAKARINMTQQEEILRLKGLGHSKAKVAKILGINRETVRKYWDGAPTESIRDIPEWVKNLDWKYIEKEINSKTPKKILYEELSEVKELPSYQSFCQYIKKSLKPDPQEKVVVRIERNPADSIEVDYSGDGVEILNPATGEVYRVELFVGSLSYSGYFYAEFTPTQKLEDFIRAHVKMFRFFSGTSRYIIPDNCKTAVTKTDYYDPLVNRTYHDMCVHYRVAVDPADGYSPRHKPNVEKAVHIVQQDFFPRIRKKTYTSLQELNRDLHTWLEAKNREVMKDRGNSRLHFFQTEKPLLAKLPDTDYYLSYFKRAKVHPDCHFQHQKNFYSVPWRFVGKEIDVKYNDRIIQAFHNLELIATHNVAKGHSRYTTNNAHYPEKKVVDLHYHLSRARSEAKKIGPNTLLLIEKLIGQEKFPLKSLRKVQGVLNLSKTFSKEQMEYGAEQALNFNRLSYLAIKKFCSSFRKEEDPRIHQSPRRQLSLICLQGGIDSANRRIIE